MEPQTIRTVYATSAEVAIDPAEALRYMGAQPGDEAAQALLEACMEKAQRAFSSFSRFAYSGACCAPFWHCAKRRPGKTP